MVYHEMDCPPADRVANIDLVSGEVPEHVSPDDKERVYDSLKDRVRSAPSIQSETRIHYSHVLQALGDSAIARRVDCSTERKHPLFTQAGAEKVRAEMTTREKFVTDALSLSKHYLSFY